MIQETVVYNIPNHQLDGFFLNFLTHICVSDLIIIGSDNGLLPGRRQAIIRTNARILLIRPLGTNFCEILIEILIFSFKKIRLKVSSAKRRPFCLSLNVLNGLSQTVLYLDISFYDPQTRHGVGLFSRSDSCWLLILLPLTFASDLVDPHRNPYHLLGSIHALASGHGAATQE